MSPRAYITKKGLIYEQIHDGIAIFDSERSLLITLNETAKIIFNGLRRGLDKNAIIGKMASKYTVTTNKASYDFDKSTKQLVKKGVIIANDSSS